MTSSFAPNIADSYNLLTAAGGLTGTFTDTILPPLPSNLGWNVLYSPTGAENSVVLEVICVSGCRPADFDGNGILDVADVDMLVGGVVNQTEPERFDMNGDGNLDVLDVNDWLAVAGARNNASGDPYIMGDANLDGSVDGSDFSYWNTNKFQLTGLWSAGDFNADGSTDGSDFSLWNTTSSNPLPRPQRCPNRLAGLCCFLV